MAMGVDSGQRNVPQSTPQATPIYLNSTFGSDNLKNHKKLDDDFRRERSESLEEQGFWDSAIGTDMDFKGSDLYSL